MHERAVVVDGYLAGRFQFSFGIVPWGDKGNVEALPLAGRKAGVFRRTVRLKDRRGRIASNAAGETVENLDFVPPLHIDAALPTLLSAHVGQKWRAVFEVDLRVLKGRLRREMPRSEPSHLHVARDNLQRISRELPHAA